MTRALPRYQCHKVVHAVRILAFEVLDDETSKIMPDDPLNGAIVTAPGWHAKFHGHENDDPGYYVVYDDGYASWSPTKPFEDGYTLLQDGLSGTGQGMTAVEPDDAVPLPPSRSRSVPCCPSPAPPPSSATRS